MPAKDLGTKLTCWKCGTKFYDLKKADPVCPKCGADPRQAPSTKSSPAAEKRAKKAAVVEEVPEVEEAELDEELDDSDDADDAEDEP